jgi:hypothetical protein
MERRLARFGCAMIGGMSPGSGHARRIRGFAGAPTDLRCLGPMSLDQVDAVTSQSDLLVYTDVPAAGSGNSLLHVWFRRFPAQLPRTVPRGLPKVA